MAQGWFISCEYSDFSGSSQCLYSTRFIVPGGAAKDRLDQVAEATVEDMA
jgi:hypothetical protein